MSVIGTVLLNSVSNFYSDEFYAQMTDELSEDSLLVADLGLSSVGVLYVVIAIEEFFDIRFDDVGFGDFKTVGDVITYIEAKVNG